MSGHRTHERIELHDSGVDIAAKLSEGNPGALSVIVEIAQRARVIDPAHILGPIGYFHSLDSAGIFGSEIWRLYKDVCGEDIRVLLTLLRASDFGIVSGERLRLECREPGHLDFAIILAQVRERVSGFAP